jgi:hypothetical protein
MLTITTEKQTLYININMLKSRFKSAFITLFKVSIYILAFAGILLIVGTAGASDSGVINLQQTIKQSLQGVFYLVLAWVLNFIKLVIE